MMSVIQGRIATLPAPVKYFMAFAAGAVMVPAMPPWNIWPLLFFGLGLFYVLLSTAEKTRTAFIYGWLFGFGYFAFGLSWISNALLVEGNEFAWVWPLAIAGLPAGLAFFPALACAGIIRFFSLKTLRGYLAFAAILMLSEWLRGHAFTGFPWNLYGYAWSDVLPMAQVVSIMGIYGLTFATMFWATLPGFLLIWPVKKTLKIILLTLLALDMSVCYLYGRERLARLPTDIRDDLVVRVVQPDILQEEKWDASMMAANLQKLLDLSYPEKVNTITDTLIVWPETAVTEYVIGNETAAAAIKAVLAAYERPVYLATGLLRSEEKEEGGREYFNSIVTFDRHLKPLSAYDKSHLVPFGEYIPLQRWLNLKPFVQYEGFTPGEGAQTAEIPAARYSPLVCYEIIFPGKVTNAAKRPDFIVNVTNDAWYGDSSGPRQHFVQAQFRAIEEGIPVVRSANTGISGVIDPLGRIIHREEMFRAAGQNVALPRALAAPTYYSIQKDRVFLALLGGLFLLLIIPEIKARKP